MRSNVVTILNNNKTIQKSSNFAPIGCVRGKNHGKISVSWWIYLLEDVIYRQRSFCQLPVRAQRLKGRWRGGLVKEINREENDSFFPFLYCWKVRVIVPRPSNVLPIFKDERQRPFQTPSATDKNTWRANQNLPARMPKSWLVFFLTKNFFFYFYISFVAWCQSLKQMDPVFNRHPSRVIFQPSWGVVSTYRMVTTEVTTSNTREKNSYLFTRVIYLEFSIPDDLFLLALQFINSVHQS